MFEILEVEVKKFRSILDSNVIRINDRIITLAGKNESGKTNILAALKSFSDDNFTEDDIPVSSPHDNPTVSILFAFDHKYLNNIIGFEIFKKGNYKLKITRSKDNVDEYSEDVYSRLTEHINDEIGRLLKNSEFTINLTQYLNNFQELSELKFELEELTSFLNRVCIERMIINSETNDTTLKAALINLGIPPESISEGQNNFSHFNVLKDLILKNFSEIYDVTKRWRNIFPEFIYFDSFNDLLPDEIDYTRLNDQEYLKEIKGFVNLLDFLDTTPSDFLSSMEEQPRKASTTLKEYDANITGNFNGIYKQDEIRIALNKDHNMIYLEIYDKNDENHAKKPSQRSKGFQWFLAFYLMFNNKVSISEKVLLVDEPGLYLHAQAQRDILDFFESKLSNTIFYTTHSPFLINTDNMNRIKLVVNDKDTTTGTKVENKYYCVSDFDTITPIITAIGYDISRSPVDLGTGLNIITEGITERYYILSFMKLFDVKKTVSVIPSIGASQTYYLAAISMGWGLDYVVLLDSDSAGKDAAKKLKKLFIDDEEMSHHVKSIDTEKNKSIETIFSDNDKEYTWYQGCGKDKTLCALDFQKNVFSGNIKKNDLDKTTQQSIANLLKNLNVT